MEINFLNPTMVRIHTEQRQAFLRNEYQQTAATEKFILEKMTQTLQRAKSQLSRFISNIDQGGAGSLQPSA